MTYHANNLQQTLRNPAKNKAHKGRIVVFLKLFYTLSLGREYVGFLLVLIHFPLICHLIGYPLGTVVKFWGLQ